MSAVYGLPGSARVDFDNYRTAVLQIVDPLYLDIYLRLQETTGTTAAEERTIYPGTYTGSYTLGNAGPFGDYHYAVDLNGSTDWVQTSFDWASHTKATIACWINTADTQGEICGDRYNGVQGVSLSLTIGQSAVAGTSGKPRFWFDADGTDAGITSTGPTVNDSTWHHIVGTYSGGGTASNMAIYVDGAAQPWASEGVGAVQSTWTGAGGMRVGSTNYGSGARWFDGLMAEFSIWRVGLTADQVARLYASANR